MKTSEIRELSTPEIEKKLRDTREQLVNLRMRKQTGQVEHPDELKKLRRDIARMETLLKSRKDESSAA